MHPVHVNISRIHQISKLRNIQLLSNHLFDTGLKNWRSSVFSRIFKILPTCFYKFCIQLIKRLAYPRDFKLSLKISSLLKETSEQADFSKLPSRSFITI